MHEATTEATYQMTIAIGYHLGVPSRAEGLSAYLETLASHGHDICLVGADEAGMLANARDLARSYGVEAWLVYRKTAYSWGTDVPIYHATPQEMAARYWDELEASWPQELGKRDVWVEFPNEPDKDNPERIEWLGQLAIESGLIALERGYNYLSPAWASGNPEPEAWQSPGWLEYLSLCMLSPHRLGISLHEYTLDPDRLMSESRPWWMGRVGALNAVCQAHDIDLPTVIMTEWGWGANAAPDAKTAVPDIIDQIQWYMSHSPNVKAVAIWGLDKAGQWSGISKDVQAYMEPLAQAIIETDWRSITMDDNLLFNGSFEEGWDDLSDRLQQPDGWELTAITPGYAISAPSRKGEDYPAVTGRVEVVHKSAQQLPPDEHLGADNALILDGRWTLDIQAVDMVSETHLTTWAAGLEPGAIYKLYAPVQVHYHGALNEPDDIEIWLWAGLTNPLKVWAKDLPDRQWVDLSVEGQADETGQMLIALWFMTKWQNSRDLFVDNLRLVKVDNGSGETPPGEHKAIVVKLAQEATWTDWERALSYAHPRRHTMTPSHDDMLTILGAGNEDSLAIIQDPEQPSQVEAIQMLERAGYQWQPMTTFSLSHWPTDYRLYTQSFGERPEYYGRFGFPGHEGVDIRAPRGSAFYAATEGTVVRAGDKRADGSDSAYGYHVILDHGQGWTTTYGHARAGLPVKVGDQVKAGQIIGHSGNTGNSSGPHLHFTLKQQGAQLPGWPSDYQDPTPLLNKIRWSRPQVPEDGPVGFVWGAGLDVAGPMAISKTALNMRERPSLAGNKIRVVSAGELVLVLDEITTAGYRHVQTRADTSAQVDMAAYFMPPEGEAAGDIAIIKNNWGQGDERSQVQWWLLDQEPPLVLQVKNELYEARAIHDGYIHLLEDSSPGGGKFYRLDSEPGWLPRRMTPGQRFTRTEHIEIYERHSCEMTKRYTSTSDMRLERVHAIWTSPHGVVLDEVAELTWLLNGQPVESYYYAPHLGLVGWSNNAGLKSSICELIPRAMEQGPRASIIDCK